MSPRTAEAPGAPVVLPKGATGVRSWRRERMKRQRRQRRFAAVLLFLSVLVAAVLVGMESPAGEHGGAPQPAPVPVPSLGPLPTLIAVTDSASVPIGIAVLIPLPSGRGGSILAVPPGTVTQVVPGGAQPLSAALVSTPNAPGPDKMIATVENMLGFAVPTIAVSKISQLATLLTPIGPLQIDLPVSIQPPKGQQGTAFPAGSVTISPGDVGWFLSDQSASGATEQAARFGGLIQAWVGQIRTRGGVPTDQSGVTGGGALGRTLTALSRGAVTVVPLPVDEIPAESSGASVEYQLDSARFAPMIPSLVPGQPGALLARPKVQLLNGTGGLGLDEESMMKLEPWVDVTLSGNACTPQGTSAQITCFGYGTTRIITYNARGRDSAARVKALLGAGEILRSSGSSDIFDMTVIIGADFHLNG